MNTEIHQIIRRRLVTKQNILVPMYKIKHLNSLVRRFLHFISLKKNYTLFFIIFWGFFYKKKLRQTSILSGRTSTPRRSRCTATGNKKKIKRGTKVKPPPQPSRKKVHTTGSVGE